MAKPRLALGTAQLGAEYGRIVIEPAPDADEARKLLDAAWDNGIRCFDTAAAYGSAEARIGAWCASRAVDPAIVTKIRLPSGNQSDAVATIEGAIHTSRTSLCGAKIETLMLHRAGDMRSGAAIAALHEATAQGRIGRWGVSVYSPDDFARALALPGIGAIEAPISVLDRRIERAGLLAAARQANVHVMARSVFLQGVLLARPDRFAGALPRLAAAVSRLGHVARRAGMPTGALALLAVATRPGLGTIVVGAANSAQVREIAAWYEASGTEIDVADIEELSDNLSTAELDPRNWPAGD